MASVHNDNSVSITDTEMRLIPSELGLRLRVTFNFQVDVPVSLLFELYNCTRLDDNLNRIHIIFN